MEGSSLGEKIRSEKASDMFIDDVLFQMSNAIIIVLRYPSSFEQGF